MGSPHTKPHTWDHGGHGRANQILSPRSSTPRTQEASQNLLSISNRSARKGFRADRQSWPGARFSRRRSGPHTKPHTARRVDRTRAPLYRGCAR